MYRPRTGRQRAVASSRRDASNKRVACIGLTALALQFGGSAPAQEAKIDSPAPEAYSLLGRPLIPMALAPEERVKLQSNLDAALAALAADPDDPEKMIWAGRRLAYLGRYRDAIAMYSRGLERWPESFKLLRHRGHRWITLREFDRAIADLEQAARLIRSRRDEVEPDGAPNSSNIPRSTSHSNIWYHLGLAYYLKGDFANADRCYRECLKFSTNDDMLCATSDWLYMTCRRLGRINAARAVLDPIRAEMEIFESHAYHRRLRMYKGEIPPDSLLSTTGATDLDIATQGYGVGNWLLCNGDTVKAKAIFQRVLEGPYWPAFGSIAAEADLARMQ